MYCAKACKQLCYASQLSILLLPILYYVKTETIYSDHWAVHVEGGEQVARNLADKHGFLYINQIMPNYYSFRHRRVAKRSVEASEHHHATLVQEPQVQWIEQQVVKSRVKRSTPTVTFNDPKWPRMWYLNRGHDVDMNVQRAWQKGYTGRNVVVSILDDGIERTHPDLRKNYDSLASYDVNGHDDDPMPRYNYNNENRHGTRCAGEVAAESNNSVCSVGVAYNAKIGGVRMLDGDVTDAVEAESLSHNPEHIDIYSASWGPDDDGSTVDGPAFLAKKAFYDGINKGRNGRGSIFVWASGNGGREGDNCNCDGYTNSIYTLSISSATENGRIPWYSEACSSTLASTYSSGSNGERQVVTTDLKNGCTETHTGTSASAPLAAGICALALQANPQLTWRDMQHIVVLTARPEELRADDWVTNGHGKKVSHHFGFGVMDANAMVDLARTWTTVPPQRRCEIRSRIKSRKVDVNGRVTVQLESDGCANSSKHNVEYLEHVQAIITLSATTRGAVEIFLTSPRGTRSTLLKKRSHDHSREGFVDWAFMTTHCWGETSRGTWTLEIRNGNTPSELKTWSLKLHGTATPVAPGHQGPPYPDGAQGSSPDCPDGQYLLDEQCYTKCPTHYYPREGLILVPPNVTQSTSFTVMPTTTPSFTTNTDHPSIQSHPSSFTFTTVATNQALPPQRSSTSDTPQNEVTYVPRRVCNPCFSTTCVTCTGGYMDQCTSCIDGYRLSKGSCVVISTVTPSVPPGSTKLPQWLVPVCVSAIVVLVIGILVALVIFYHRWKNNITYHSLETAKSLLNSMEDVEEYRDEDEDDDDNDNAIDNETNSKIPYLTDNLSLPEKPSNSIHIDMNNHNSVTYKTDI